MHAAQGSVLQRLRRLDDAALHYTRAIDLGLGDVQVWTNLGEVQLERFAFAEAALALERAIALDKDGRHPSGARARALVLKVAKQAR